jgi:hypothetical protein
MFTDLLRVMHAGIQRNLLHLDHARDRFARVPIWNLLVRHSVVISSSSIFSAVDYVYA